MRRTGIGRATRVGAWWGPSLHALRRAGERTTEEIDIVGLQGRRATVVGEVRWRSGPMSVSILGELDRYKLLALEQAGVQVGRPRVVLVSQSGFTDGLRAAAAADARLSLIDPDVLAGDVMAS